MDNYPPGVSGNEYEINGPDWEHESVEWCEHCRHDQPGTFFGYGKQVWFTCSECRKDTDNSEIGERLTEIYRRRKGRG